MALQAAAPVRRPNIDPEEWKLRVDLAAAYINASISPDVQAKMGDAPYMLVPTNSKVAMSKPLQFYAKSFGDLDKMNTVDWAKLNPKRAEYIERFNREVKA